LLPRAHGVSLILDGIIDARGYIHVPDWEELGLSEPYTIPLNREDDGPGYMISVFHQLHCLVCYPTAVELTGVDSVITSHISYNNSKLVLLASI
jgi:hypothetical protein